MTVLVDSDILIEVSRGRDASVVSKWVQLSASDALILFSPVTLAELWAGARPTEHDALTALFEALICIPTDADIGRRAGEYVHRYRKSHNIELGDAIIAATAAARTALLWTRNRKHYPMKEIEFFDSGMTKPVR